ncbi:MAG: DUF2304 domain-containing protein [Acidimicrobiales bacterium]
MNLRAHLVAVAVTLACVGAIAHLLRKGRLRAKYALLWLSLGVALVVLAVVPSLAATVSGWLGIYYAPATLFLFAIVLLLLVSIHFSWELSRSEERTRLLAEELALVELRVARLESAGAQTSPTAREPVALGSGTNASSRREEAPQPL